MSKIIPAFLALPVLALTVLVGISVPGNAADATGSANNLLAAAGRFTSVRSPRLVERRATHPAFDSQ
jgi:hypothetical protein